MPPTHINNFDFLRLLLATFVLVTHAYPLVGLPEVDPLGQVFHAQGLHGVVNLSNLAVPGFLTTSGYLILKSFTRSKSLLDYYFKRAVRVLPGLWVLIGLTVLIGFFLSGKTINQYLQHYSTRDYLFFNSLLKIRFEIDGVFTYNPYPRILNASLWTIPYEVHFYVWLSALYLVRHNRMVLRLLIGSTFLVSAGVAVFFFDNLAGIIVGPFFELKLNSLVEFLAFFTGGALVALVDLPPTKTLRVVAACSFAGLVISLLVPGLFIYAQFVVIPLLTISFGSLNFPALSWIRQYGDISYGVYLWGFFVQQLLLYFFHLNLWQLQFSGIVASYMIGYFSWRLVEKPALSLKYT